MANDIGFVPDGQQSTGAAAPVMANNLGFVPDAGSTPAAGGTPQGGASVATATPQGGQNGGLLDSMTVPTIFPASKDDSQLTAGLKTAGNVPGSAVNFALGLAKLPFQGAENIAKDVSGFGDAAKNFGGGLGGFLKTAGTLAENLPGAAYQTLIPQSARNLINAGVNASGAVKGNFFLPPLPKEIRDIIAPEGDTGTAIEGARQSITNDPVGQVLPFLLLGREAAYKVSPDAGAVFDTAVTKVAKPVTALGDFAGTLMGKAGDAAGGMGRFAAAQATGLNPETIKTISENPGEFSKTNMQVIDRPKLGGEIQAGMRAKLAATGFSEESIAADVQKAFDSRFEDQESSGKEYNPIKASKGAVNIDPSFLKNLIEETTGVKISETTPAQESYIDQTTNETVPAQEAKTGKIGTSGSASIRDATDVRALQNLYNTWQPLFERGTMTPKEFLNLRSDLADMSGFEREITKSKPLENLSKIMRGKLNTAYRGSIPGLEDVDANFFSQTQELNFLKKGLVDKDGNLTDAAISRIGRATDAKPNLATKLEDLSPGIMKKLSALRQVRELGAGLVDENGNLKEAALNKIANATGKGKDMLLSRLEDISPGITKRIQTLKAIEDIENASGQKVGVYNRGLGAVLGGGAGFATGGVMGAAVGAIAEMILASPEVAVPLFRAYGNIKGLWSGVISVLKSGGSAVNNLTEGAPPLQSVIPKAVGAAEDYFDENPPGLTLKAVSEAGATPDPVLQAKVNSLVQESNVKLMGNLQSTLDFYKKSKASGNLPLWEERRPGSLDKAITQVEDMISGIKSGKKGSGFRTTQEPIEIEHRTDGKMKYSPSTGAYFGKPGEVDSGFGDTVIKKVIKPGSSIFEFPNSFEFLDAQGYLDTPNKDLLRKYGDEVPALHDSPTLRTLWDNSGDMSMPNAIYAEAEHRAVGIIKRAFNPDVILFTSEDDLVPEQYVVQNLNALEDKKL